MLQSLMTQLMHGISNTQPTQVQQAPQELQQAPNQQTMDHMGALYAKLDKYRTGAQSLPYDNLDGTYTGQQPGTTIFRDSTPPLINNGVSRFDPTGRDVPEFDSSEYPVLPINPDLVNRLKITPIAETYRR